LKTTLDDDGKADNISGDDKKEFQYLIVKTLIGWGRTRKLTRRKVENIANPIIRYFYAGGDAAMCGFGDEL